jgi:CRISPR/Cas system-associated exonuclease Cas4 (RecB family)
MTTPVRLSNSELQTFKDCRRRWWFTYYRRLQPKERQSTGALALGSRIHEALDQYYSTGKSLLEAHNELVEQEKSQLLADFRDVSSLESEAELGHIMLEGYLQWVEENGIDVELDIISTEEIITVPLFNGEVELTGKLDMRVRRKIDGVRMFRDFKTVGGSLSEFANLANMNEQVLTYMTLEALKEGEENRSEGGIFTLIKKVKRTAAARPPFYDQVEVRHNIFTLRSFWDRLHGTIADLMRARKALDEGESPAYHVYPRPSRDCKWKCPFYTVCTLVDDGSAAEQAIEQMYDVADPYAYYGEGETKGSE